MCHVAAPADPSNHYDVYSVLAQPDAENNGGANRYG
jgi:hypothetical protein